jgi:hypothetical protein
MKNPASTSRKITCGRNKSEDAGAIHNYLDDYYREAPGLMVVSNDVHARFHPALRCGRRQML